MISLIIALISGFMYVIGSLALILGFFIFPFLIKGGWIFSVMIFCIIAIEIILSKLEEDDDNENRN